MRFNRKVMQKISAKCSAAGKRGARVRAEKRMAGAAAATYCGTIRCYGPAFRGLSQMRLMFDGVHVWHVSSDGSVGRRRTFPGFCKSMNRRLWRATQA